MKDKEVAGILLKRKAILLSPDKPFTWASGIKSPIYADNRKLISTVEERGRIVEKFAEILSHVQFDLIAGTATAGIPWASFLAQKLGKPMIYVRSKPKDHGTGGSIEGELKSGQKVVVVEDLVSTGGSSVTVIKEIRDGGGIVDQCVSIFSYNFKSSREAFQACGVVLHPLTDFETLIDEAEREKYISSEQKNFVIEWRKQFL